MVITVEKGINKKISEMEFIEAAEYMLSLLLPNHILQKLDIDIIFQKDMPSSKEYAYFYCADERVKSREFVIYIRPTLSIKNQLISLAHELVHIKQCATGEVMTFSSSRKKAGYDLFDKYYMDPMEIEAHGKEFGLYTAWCIKKGRLLDAAFL